MNKGIGDGASPPRRDYLRRLGYEPLSRQDPAKGTSSDSAVDRRKRHTTGSSALGDRLRKERRRRGETQAQAAARFGINQASYSRWETGENVPSDDRFDEIGRYIGATVEEVWELVHSTSAPPILEDVRSELAALKGEVAQLRTHLERLNPPPRP